MNCKKHNIITCTATRLFNPFQWGGLAPPPSLLMVYLRAVETKFFPKDRPLRTQGTANDPSGDRTGLFKLS